MKISQRHLHLIIYVLAGILLMQGLYIVLTSNEISTMTSPADNDGFFGLFRRNLIYGAYAENARGTSVLYMLLLKILHFFFQNVEASFYVLNVCCLLFILVFSLFLILKFGLHKAYAIALAVIFLVYFIVKKNTIATYDDNLQGCIYLMIIYFLLEFKKTNSNNALVCAGILLGLAFSTRPLAVFFLPVIGMFILFYSRKVWLSSLRVIIPSLIIIITFHLPSLLNDGSLSYYDKNPPGYSWMQRNYLGIKKMDEGQLSIKPWSIWRGTSWQEVDTYLQKNGKDALPRNYTEAIVKSPQLFVKAWVYNLYTTVKNYFYIVGFLLFLPLYAITFRRKYKFSGLPEYAMFIAFTTAVTFAAYSYVEFRWFLGTEILLFISIALITRMMAENNKNALLNLTYICSLLFLIFNYLRYTF